MTAVASHEQWAEVYDRLAALIAGHRTTLIFVNTRRLAERVAHHLAERVGEEHVASHHGSLSKERRLQMEQRLKSGDLRALVATASLELGIDIGSIDLVCQIASPRAISTFLQRVGRSGHALGLTPRGKLFPTTRDELVECAALVRAVRAGRLDRVQQPVAPLDVLAQQIVAETACEDWPVDALFGLVRRAAPYRDLRRDDFDAVVAMLRDGVGESGGRAHPLIHHDRINGVIRARRGARMKALTNGGTIPELGDYRVVAEPDGTFVGTVNEDWAIESMAGDIFLLGTTSWRIKRIESGTVRVENAQGAPPTIPFWLGEAPGRTVELSAEVSALRRDIAAGAADIEATTEMLHEACGLDALGAAQLFDYVHATDVALGVVPSDTDVVFERFFDEAGDQHLVVHAPFGARINRAWGLALRKRFCVRFDFELQAAANDDAIVLSIGPAQSFPLEEVFGYLTAATAEPALSQAILYVPQWGTRWRWNVTRALAVERQRGGKRVPPQLQRMRADDLLAAVFPAQVGCQENLTGPLDYPDHPLVRQSREDCLREWMDTDGLVATLARIEAGAIRLHARDTVEPSPMAHEIINGKPYTFLDDAPLEERRTRAVMLRHALPSDARDLSALDPAAIARVREEAWPVPRDAEEVHDALLSLVALSDRHVAGWEAWLDDLAGQGRAAVVEPAGSLPGAAPRLLVRRREPPPHRAAVPGRAHRPAALSPVWRGRRRRRPRGRPRPPAARPLRGRGPRHRRGARGPLRPARRGRRARPRPGRGRRPRAARSLHAVRRRDRPPADARRPRHAPRRAGRILRPPSPGAHPSLHPRLPAQADRARRRARLHALPPALAALRARHPPARQAGPARRRRAAAGLRGPRRRLGARPPPDPPDRLRPRLARRAVPRRHAHLGPPQPPQVEPRRRPARQPLPRDARQPGPARRLPPAPGRHRRPPGGHDRRRHPGRARRARRGRVPRRA